MVVGFLLFIGGFAGAAPALIEAIFTKYSVEGGFGGDVDAFIQKGGNDLGGRHGGKAG